METEQKIITVKAGREGQETIKRYIRRGWKVVSSTSADQGYSAGKTVALGLVFLPLALLGKKKAQMTYVIEIEKGKEKKLGPLDAYYARVDDMRYR